MPEMTRMVKRRRVTELAAAIAAAALFAAPSVARQHRIENVLVVTIDGLRWQELFGGLSEDLLKGEGSGVRDAEPVRARFAGASAEERRARLMPFFWSTVATQGQVFGDPLSGSVVRVVNETKVSYPGYNELLAGFPDPRIDSNKPIPNPNETVLEWLNGKPPFRGRVAAFASWEILPAILNEARSGVFCNGEGAPVASPATERDRLLNEFAADLPPVWGATRLDAPTMFGAIEYLRTKRPRVLYVMLGETDQWAHERRYDLYLDAAHRNDRMIRRLWEAAQSMPGYKDRTALVLASDHGRGGTEKDWTSHGRDVAGAERIWMAVIGPGIAAQGTRENVGAVQGQLAATVAALLGEDYLAAQPKASPPLPLGQEPR